jgi:hypothetical protein
MVASISLSRIFFFLIMKQSSSRHLEFSTILFFYVILNHTCNIFSKIEGPVLSDSNNSIQVQVCCWDRRENTYALLQNRRQSHMADLHVDMNNPCELWPTRSPWQVDQSIVGALGVRRNSSCIWKRYTSPGRSQSHSERRQYQSCQLLVRIVISPSSSLLLLTHSSVE